MEYHDVLIPNSQSWVFLISYWNKTISDGGITVAFWIIKVHTSNWSLNNWDHRIFGDHRAPLDHLETLTIHLWSSANILPKSIKSPSYNEINLLYLIASSFIQTHGFEPTLYFLGFPWIAVIHCIFRADQLKKPPCILHTKGTFQNCSSERDN